METWLTEGVIAMVFVAMAVPIALLPVVNRVYRRYGRFVGWPAVLAFATVAMGCGLVAFTLFPLPDTSSLDCGLRSNFDFWRVRPFASVDPVVDAAARDGLRTTLTSTAFLQLLFNVVLFVPIGFLAHQELRWRFPSIVALGFGIAAAVELTQGTAIFGLYDCPYRVAEFDDLLTNTTGAAIGAILSALASRLFSLTAPEPSADLDRPTLRRRGAATLLDLVAFAVLGGLLAVALRLLAGLVGFDTDNTPLTATRWVLQGPVAALIVGLAVPLLRRDDATPGQAAVDICLDDADRTSLVRRWIVRWLPMAVLPLGVAMWAIDLLVAWRRADDRSLAGLAGKTRTVTRRAHARR